ncbi:MAG: TonB-dependent siderophore receptor [Nitrobacter sp.]
MLSCQLVQAQDATPIPDVSVNAPAAQPADGSVAAGYRVGNITTLGPFSGMKLQDTPYSITVLSNEFLENTQSFATPGAFAEKLPSVQFNYSDQRTVTGVSSFRGISFGTNQQLVDGLPVSTTSSVLFLEPYDRIEVMSGLSGFMYGIGSSAGMFNYVLKRPTPQPFTQLTVGTPNGPNAYAHADISGATKDGALAYRFNVVGQGGDTGVDDQRLRKALISSAIDLHLSDRALVQFDASYSDFYQNELPPTWATQPATVRFPAPPDSNRDWGQPWTFADVRTAMAGTKVTLNLSDNFTSRSSLRFVDTKYDSTYINNFVQADGTYTQRVNTVRNYDRSQLSGYQFFDATFDTFSIAHKLTFGFSGTEYQENNARDYLKRVTLPYFFSLAAPQQVPNPNLVAGTLSTYTPIQTFSKNWTIGDQIDFNQHWSAIAGVTYSSIDDNTYDITGAPVSHYNAGAPTPTISLIFKPTSWLTTYASYVQALQEGTVVSGPEFTNNGTVLPPYLRNQYEVGIKATLGNTLVTLAAFEIDSALQYSVNNVDGTSTFRQDGRQRNRGIETTVTGEVVPGVRVLGGFTLLDAKVTKNDSTPEYVGKQVQGVANQLVKVTAEYDLPFISRLTLTGGAYYTSDFYADQLNTDKLSGRVTFDAGFRYATAVEGHPLTFRFNVSNLTDERYWLGPSTLGDARRYTASAQATF